MTDDGSLLEPAQILRYGPHRDQRIELTPPSGPPRGTVALIHGGYWRARFTAEITRPLVNRFVERGWLVANIEYRRGEDGWSATHEDLLKSLASVRSLSSDAPVAIIGHSVGGQLALLGGDEGDAIVALAPVTDLTRGYHEGIGDDAVAEFLRASPGDLPDVYAEASPMSNLPPRGDVLLVHGRDDDRVPIAHSRDYVDRARAAGAEIQFFELPQLSHLAAIDPAAPHWIRVDEWLDREMPRPA